MDSLGHTIRQLRVDKKLPLRTVAENLEIDQAILSKIERGHRQPSRALVVKLAKYFKIKQKDLLVQWLSDKLFYAVEGEDVALNALQAAEDKVAYLAFKKVDRKIILKELINAIKRFSKIEKAWIYGSFSREDDGPKSDIDIAIKTNETFSYFDLAEVQFQLEQLIKRRIDVGFIDSFRPYIFEHVKPDLKLIYERPS